MLRISLKTHEFCTLQNQPVPSATVSGESVPGSLSEVYSDTNITSSVDIGNIEEYRHVYDNYTFDTKINQNLSIGDYREHVSSVMEV